jgi:hypothetical protein
VPAILAPALKERIDELKRDSFSQHAIETVCFDLRIRRAHVASPSRTGIYFRPRTAGDRKLCTYGRKLHSWCVDFTFLKMRTT